VADVEALFDDFMARYHAGDAPDVLDYVDEAGTDADALMAMIEALVPDSATPPVTAAATERAARLIDQTTAVSFHDQQRAEPESGFWSRVKGHIPEWRVVVAGLGAAAGARALKTSSARRLLASYMRDSPGRRGRASLLVALYAALRRRKSKTGADAEEDWWRKTG
jgi:hypothetical protein